MGRKKKGGKSILTNSDGNEDDDVHDPKDDVFHHLDLPDDFSIAAASSVQSGNSNDGPISESDRHMKLVDALSLAATFSCEKRSAKRESIHRAIFQCVTHCVTGRPALLAHWQDVSCACALSLRDGSAAEQYAACRVLEASWIVLADEDLVGSWDGPLKRVVDATARAAPVRAAALRSLAMMHFICRTEWFEEGQDLATVMRLCERVSEERYRGEQVPPILRTAALDAWAFLGTTCNDALIAAGNDTEDDPVLGRGLELLPLLTRCLDSSSVELRESAGECFAFIHECRLNLGVDEEQANNVTIRRYRRGSWDGTQWEVIMDEVKQRIAQLSVESGHHMSKKSKKQQRATFREYMNTIVDNEAPKELVTFRGGKLTLTSWKQIIQLNFIRHCLQAGFQIQLMNNETLKEIFHSCFTASGVSLSQLEKRLTMSKTSESAKAADNALTRQRRSRTNVKNHFLFADDDGD